MVPSQLSEAVAHVNVGLVEENSFEERSLKWSLKTCKFPGEGSTALFNRDSSNRIWWFSGGSRGSWWGVVCMMWFGSLKDSAWVRFEQMGNSISWRRVLWKLFTYKTLKNWNKSSLVTVIKVYKVIWDFIFVDWTYKVNVFINVMKLEHKIKHAVKSATSVSSWSSTCSLRRKALAENFWSACFHFSEEFVFFCFYF